MRVNKKENVVNTAQILFARYGFNKTTIDDISKKAHTAKSTIYNYFSSKEEIFEKVIEMEGRHLRSEICKAIKDINDPVEKMRVYAVTRMKYIKMLVNFYSAMTDEFLEHYSFIEKARKNSLENELCMIKSILKEGVEKGVFDIVDLNWTSFAIITAWRGLDLPWTENVRKIKENEDIDFLLNVLFNGIRKR